MRLHIERGLARRLIIFVVAIPGLLSAQHYRPGMPCEDTACLVLFKDTFANGAVRASGMYRHGLREGLHVAYLPNGLLHWLGFYLNDKPVGLHCCYHPNGVRAVEQFWYSKGAAEYNMIDMHTDFAGYDLLLDDSTMYGGNTFDTSGKPLIQVERLSGFGQQPYVLRIQDFRGTGLRRGRLTHILNEQADVSMWKLEWD